MQFDWHAQQQQQQQQMQRMPRDVGRLLVQNLNVSSFEIVFTLRVNFVIKRSGYGFEYFSGPTFWSYARERAPQCLIFSTNVDDYHYREQTINMWRLVHLKSRSRMTRIIFTRKEKRR
ncbi:unnamed protein product [Trichogramma brassicae]|uniref:Uncharacterized protein n=1 Tax=Trichogramma brassicae TaxID=86971 RepID=A0A6H5IVH6_9HYME|nr:unnamed protein product [Trichogramma brassicae]